MRNPICQPAKIKSAFFSKMCSDICVLLISLHMAEQVLGMYRCLPAPLFPLVSRFAPEQQCKWKNLAEGFCFSMNLFKRASANKHWSPTCSLLHYITRFIDSRYQIGYECDIAGGLVTLLNFLRETRTQVQGKKIHRTALSVFI